ncbi:MAG: thioesterase family protein [Xanthomonadales bacterium]|nr:thioesterase family protein [Xanthomonadales bacterium]
MFEFELQPRLSETDGLGHINNTVLPAWFEEARRELFRIFNADESLAAWNLILKKYEIELHGQIRHDAPVRIETAVAGVGTTSLVVVQEAFQAGLPVASANTVLVHFDYAGQQPAPIPPEIRSQLEEHLRAKAEP